MRLALLVLLLPGAAWAQGLTAPSVGTGASSPVHADAAAVYWNPGLLGMLDRGTLLVGGHLIAGDIRYQRQRRAIYQDVDSLAFAEPIDPLSIDAGKTGWADEEHANPIGFAPTVFAARPLGRKLVAGAGVSVPYAGILDFDGDGAQRWQLQHATILAVSFDAAVAYRAHERVSFGAGLAYVLGYADLAKVQDFAALDDVGQALASDPLNQANDFGAGAPPSVRELSVTSRPFAVENAIAHGLTFSLGVAARPLDRLLVGLSYRHSVRMSFNGRFTLDMDDDFFTQDLASKGLEFVPLVVGDATLGITLPRAIMAGARHQVTRALALAVTVVYTTYSQVESLDIAVRSPDLAQPVIGLTDTARVSLPRRWQDTIAVDLSAHGTISARLGLWGGVGFRSATSPDETIDVASVDGDRLVGNAGVTIALSPSMTLVGEAKVQHMLTREVEASDHDLGNGRYGLTLVLVGAHVAVALP